MNMDAVLSERRIAGLRIRRIATEPSPQIDEVWQPKDDLPDLAPPEMRLKEWKLQIFESDKIRLTQSSAVEDVLNPSERAEHHDPVARATVYVMNMIVIVMSMPVGLALLFFNIVGGENFRTTAHMIALTGMGIALANANPAAPTLLSLL